MQTKPIHKAKTLKSLIRPAAMMALLGGLLGGAWGAGSTAQPILSSVIFSVLAGGLMVYLYSATVVAGWARRHGMDALWRTIFIHAWRWAPYSLSGGAIAWLIQAH